MPLTLGRSAIFIERQRLKRAAIRGRARLTKTTPAEGGRPGAGVAKSCRENSRTLQGRRQAQASADRLIIEVMLHRCDDRYRFIPVRLRRSRRLP